MNNKYVLAAHVLLEGHVALAVGKAFDFRLSNLHLEVPRNLFCQRVVGVTGNDTDFIVERLVQVVCQRLVRRPNAHFPITGVAPRPPPILNP